MADLGVVPGDLVALAQLHDVPEASAVVVQCRGPLPAPPALLQRAVLRHFGVTPPVGGGGGSSGGSGASSGGGGGLDSMLAVARAVVADGISAAEEALIRAQAARTVCRFLPVVAGQSLRVPLPTGAVAHLVVAQTAPRHSTVIVGPDTAVSFVAPPGE